MTRVKKELELLKSWGFETVSIDKVLEMIERTEDTESEPEEKHVINIYCPSYTREDRVDRYFWETPTYTASDRTFPGEDLLPFVRKTWYT